MKHLFKPYGVFSNNCQTFQKFNLNRSHVSLDKSQPDIELVCLLSSESGAEDGVRYGSTTTNFSSMRLRPGTSLQNDDEDGSSAERDRRTNFDKCCTWCWLNMKRHRMIVFIVVTMIIILMTIACA